MFEATLLAQAVTLLDLCRNKRLTITTAESCTGGLVSALLTEIPGSSDVFERGFATYSNAAKAELLGVDPGIIAASGAVSQDVARAMAEGALLRSAATLSVAVTGVAGPGGGSALKPVGLVHLAAARDGCSTLHRECRFGMRPRGEIRQLSLAVALELLAAQATAA